MNEGTVRLPPQNIEAEQSVLGSILIDSKSLDRVVDILKSESFYRRAHQIIYDALIALYEKRESIDVLTLKNILRERKQLDLVGGVSYITTLVNSVPTAAHVEQHAKIVHRKKMLRDLIDASHDIISLSNKEEESLENLLDQAEQRLFSVSQQFISYNFSPVKASLEEAFERLERLHRGDGALRGVTSGFYDLDVMLSGFQKSDLVVLAARPSMGKSALALDFARNAAHAGIATGFFGLEMSKEQVIDRLIASEAGVGLWKLRTGKLSSEGENNDFSKISRALDSLAKLPLFIDDSPSPNILQLRAMARRLQAKHKLGLVIVDYLQLITPTTSSDNEVQQITEISRSLKALGRELNVPVIAISQLSRAVEARTSQRPKLSDLRSSGSIEQDADVVMFIYRQDKTRENTERRNIAEIIVEKQRNGPTGSIELYFDENEASFKNLAKNR